MTIKDILLDSFGETFHSGLRKGLSSPWSAKAWREITKLDNVEWVDFCDWAKEKIKDWPDYEAPSKDQIYSLFDYTRSSKLHDLFTYADDKDISDMHNWFEFCVGFWSGKY